MGDKKPTIFQAGLFVLLIDLFGFRLETYLSVIF